MLYVISITTNDRKFRNGFAIAEKCLNMGNHVVYESFERSSATRMKYYSLVISDSSSTPLALEKSSTEKTGSLENKKNPPQAEQTHENIEFVREHHLVYQNKKQWRSSRLNGQNNFQPYCVIT